MMFSLASADIGYTYYLVFVKLMQGDLNFKLLYPKYVMFVTNGYVVLRSVPVLSIDLIFLVSPVCLRTPCW